MPNLHKREVVQSNQIYDSNKNSQSIEFFALLRSFLPEGGAPLRQKQSIHLCSNISQRITRIRNESSAVHGCYHLEFRDSLVFCFFDKNLSIRFGNRFHWSFQFRLYVCKAKRSIMFLVQLYFSNCRYFIGPLQKGTFNVYQTQTLSIIAHTHANKSLLSISWQTKIVSMFGYIFQYIGNLLSLRRIPK